jgi:hypothetical protein
VADGADSPTRASAKHEAKRLAQIKKRKYLIIRHLRFAFMYLF